MAGRTDRVVVVGAGLAGLSAALRLVGRGREVTVLERAAQPGGRCGLVELDGYAIDTGPTVLTMPGLVADALDCVGERLEDWLELRAVTPLYRACYPDGSRLDVHAEPERMAAEVARVCGPREAAGYRRYRDFVSALYRAQLRHFIDRNFDSPLGVLAPSALPDLARLVALGGFRRLAPVVGRYLTDPRTRRVFSFQSMYAGLSPYDALALYAVISYLDSVAGVFFPVGGMHALPRALAGAAVKHGAAIRYATRVERLEVRGGRAVAAWTTDGERIAADAFVLTGDLPVAYRELLGPAATPKRLARLRFSPSCFLLLAGSRAGYAQSAHHTVHFGRAWKRTFAELVDRGELMSDPSLLVSTPTRTDPGLAPPGRHIYYVLVPTPNTDADLDWSVIGPRYRSELLDRLERFGYRGFAAGIEVEQVTTPADWAARGFERGTPFAAAHTFRQTGPFRPANLARGVEGVVFAGSGTVPGVGIPMVLLSGRLAAERVCGRDQAYRSRAWPTGR